MTFNAPLTELSSPTLKKKSPVVQLPEACLQNPWTSLIWRILKGELVWAVAHGFDSNLIFKNPSRQPLILRQKLRNSVLEVFSFVVDFYRQYFGSVKILHYQNISWNVARSSGLQYVVPSLGFNCGVNLGENDILPCGTYWKKAPLLWTLGDLCLSAPWPWATCWPSWSCFSVCSPRLRWWRGSTRLPGSA